LLVKNKIRSQDKIRQSRQQLAINAGIIFETRDDKIPHPLFVGTDRITGRAYEIATDLHFRLQTVFGKSEFRPLGVHLQINVETATGRES
jgi:hypothetical protein